MICIEDIYVWNGHVAIYDRLKDKSLVMSFILVRVGLLSNEKQINHVYIWNKN